jgi:NADPH:quinone reductase-like Zn-dependent oxidoreductase
MRKDDTQLKPRKRPKPKHRRVFASFPKVPVEKKETMKAAAIDEFGPPSVLTIHELRVPEPGPNEVLIALYTAGVGVWDAKIRRGWWPAGEPKFPLVLGTDGAGIVAGTGANVRDFHTSDRVWAYEFINPKGGFYAEYVTVDEKHVSLVPRRLDLLQAGAATATGLTAIQGIEIHLRVRAVDTVLIFGASGAVGSLAVQFAKSYDARVIGTARGTDAKALVKQLGADKVIDPTSDDAVEQVRAFAPNGIDALLALAGGDSLQRLLALVRPGGRVAYPNGVEPEPKSPPNVELVAYDAEASPREFSRLNHGVDAARLRVPIAAVRRLEEAAQAHERIEKGQVHGRIALQIRKARAALT